MVDTADVAAAYSDIIKLMRNAPNNMRNHLLLEGNYWAGLHAQVKTLLYIGVASVVDCYTSSNNVWCCDELKRHAMAHIRGGAAPTTFTWG